MKEADLNEIAEEFEMISDETHLFYNTETGEFDFYADFMEPGDADAEKFEEDCWVAAPSQRDIGEYGMMSDFTDTVTDPRKNELLRVALEGRGAFRRFKDTLHRVGLTEQWYAFRRAAYVELAREWCEENEIPYDEKKYPKTVPEVQMEPAMMCHVTVRTAKLQETVEFYQCLLGLPISRRLSAPGCEIVFLGENETKLEMIGDGKAGLVNANGLTIGFAVDDLDEKLAMLDGREIPHSDIISPSPNVRFVFFSDLNGCGIQLLEEY
jgi:predicted enzyme related to lactoylglutathione lyase